MSDFDIGGSGYANVSVPVCSGLVERGHEVKAIGIGYNNQEHDFPFQLLPARNIKEASAEVLNLQNSWEAEVVVVALDIPIQERIINAPYLRDRKLKYVGLFPIEAEPLCFSWAMILMQMDKSLVISEFGTEEARKAGVEADYVQIGLDIESWKMVTPEEKSKLRGSFGFDDDTFVVLTIADNQERKNLVAAMDMFKEFAKDKENVRYVMVTREHNPVGWKLRDYAQEIGIGEKLMIFERGMSHKDLWVTYAISDVFLLTSKAEGLGMPLLEAMAVGIPCVATDCTGMAELLSGKRGFLVPSNYVHRDPFGNGRRYWISKDAGTLWLSTIYYTINPDNDWFSDDEQIYQVKRLEKTIEKARKYVEERKWDIAIDQVEKTLLEVLESE